MGTFLTVLIAGIIAAVFAAIVVQSVRAHKRGGGCSCGCAGCPNSGLCHAQSSGQQRASVPGAAQSK